MKTARYLTIAFALLLFATPAAVLAEGWSLPNLNPFAAKPKKSTSGFASKRTTTPSTWQKITTGTSNAVKSTTTALNPWKTETKPQPRMSSTGSNIRTASKPKKSTNEGATWYKPTTWFSGEEKPAPKQPGSVPDFLGQPRVGY